MSMFSEYLKQLVRNRAISIAKLSRDSGVERTAIHKALADERILPYHAVDLLAYHLKLSPKESQTFHQFYEQLFESENVRRARDIVDRIFCRLSELPDTAGDGVRYVQVPFSSGLSQARETFHGYGEVSRMIQMMLAEEAEYGKPELELAAPPDMQGMRAGIEKLYMAGADIAISHIICFEASDQGEKYNLQNLEYLGCVLPCCILSNQKYHVYYYYNDKIQMRYTDPLPYFLVTHTGVLCFSENFQTAILLREDEQIAYFCSHFYQLKKFCHELVCYASGKNQENREGVRKWNTEAGYCFITGQPYRLRIAVKNLIMVFTRSSVLEFLQTGRMGNWEMGTAEVVSEEKRLEMLGRLKKDIDDGCAKGRMVNNVQFTVPDKLAVLTSPNTCVISCGKGANVRVEIQERSLCSAFYDWAVHFSESDCVYGREKTVEALAEICQLWQKGVE